IYGVPILEWVDGPTRHLKIGSNEVRTSRIETAKKHLPNSELNVQVPGSAGRWVLSPFDGTLEASTQAFCKSPSPFSQPIYRTNSRQGGSSPIAPRIASFSTLQKLQQAISTDISSLNEYRPWQPSACDFNFERTAGLSDSIEARAYLAA